jgi:hypothetical protein
MNKTKFTLLIGLGLLTGWLNPSAIQAAGHPHSGVIGQVFIGPTCPNISPGFDCADRPFQTSISVYSDTGRFIIRFTTAAEGQFEVTLKPGNYVLVPAGAGSPHPPFVAAIEVVVHRKEFTPVIISYDSGLR